MISNDIKMRLLPGEFAVCKISSMYDADLTREFVFLSKTDEEISLVCEVAHIPQNTIAAELGWRLFGICGKLDFTMVGVIARISSIFADNGISLFVVSTYNTDYVLVKDIYIDDVVRVLGDDGILITGL